MRFRANIGAMFFMAAFLFLCAALWFAGVQAIERAQQRNKRNDTAYLRAVCKGDVVGAAKHQYYCQAR